MTSKNLSFDEISHRAFLRRELADYERQVVEQARRIAAGKSAAQPTPEHLRVLLQWLDGHATGAGPRVVH